MPPGILEELLPNIYKAVDLAEKGWIIMDVIMHCPWSPSELMTLFALLGVWPSDRPQLSAMPWNCLCWGESHGPFPTVAHQRAVQSNNWLNQGKTILAPYPNPPQLRKACRLQNSTWGWLTALLRHINPASSTLWCGSWPQGHSLINLLQTSLSRSSS